MFLRGFWFRELRCSCGPAMAGSPHFSNASGHGDRAPWLQSTSRRIGRSRATCMLWYDRPMETDEPLQPDNAVFGEIQVILSEKRTSLSALRTGIAVFALPLSVLSVLVATSKYYSMGNAAPLLVPLLVICLGLVVLGAWLIYHSIRRIHHYDRVIRDLTKKYRALADYVDQ